MTNIPSELIRKVILGTESLEDGDIFKEMALDLFKQGYVLGATDCLIQQTGLDVTPLQWRKIIEMPKYSIPDSPEGTEISEVSLIAIADALSQIGL